MINKRALIVDDSTTAQYRLKQMLRAYALDIDTADSGEAALRYLAKNAPDVIFMDHLMPGMDGFRALQIIKSHPETAMIPVIMYTSKSGDVYTGQARALGALDVVSKDTITAAKLSSVMQTIHIYRTDKKNEPSADKTDAPASNHSSNSIATTDTSNTGLLIERRAPSQASIEQARNLELRLSHMEHTLEDSRRFITARVVRELQGLKQNLKQEFSSIIENTQAPIAAEIPEPDKTPNTPIWSNIGKALIIVLLIFITFYLTKMSEALSKAQEQQQQLSTQLNTLSTPKTTSPTETIQTIKASTPTKIATVKVNAENNYLTELAWTFNQTAALNFNQNTIDTKTVNRLYDLLNRLIIKGFKGKAWVNIYVGDFCLVTNNLGEAQVVNENLNMGNCMLSSEIYGLDRLMEQYQHDTESTLNGLEQKPEKALNIIINTFSEPDNYPERKATLQSKYWNNAAQAHNRIELRLEANAP